MTPIHFTVLILFLLSALTGRELKMFLASRDSADLTELIVAALMTLAVFGLYLVERKPNDSHENHPPEHRLSTDR